MVSRQDPGLIQRANPSLILPVINPPKPNQTVRNLLKGPGRLATPPDPRMMTVLPRGPRWLHLVNVEMQASGPGEPPPGFVTPHTSATEWLVYWALAKIFNNPRDPRQFPFIGGWPDWLYQVGLDGTRANALVDFMINRPANARRLGLRIQTGYFHYGKGSEVIVFDQQQLAALLRYIDVVDIPDTELLGDDSGQKAIVRVKAALGMLLTNDPILAGTVHRGG